MHLYLSPPTAVSE